MERRIREELLGVRKILARWDPLGVIDSLEEDGLPPDEYDSYAPAILTMLRGGATQDAIVQHLRLIQVRSMGLASSPDHDRWIADQLLEWWRSRQ